MEKKVIVVFVLLFCVLYTAAIAAQDRKSSFTDSNSAKVKVNQLGFGKRVNVTLQDGGRTAGRITGLGEDHFVVTDSKGVIFKIEYTDLSRIKTKRKAAGVRKAVCGICNHGSAGGHVCGDDDGLLQMKWNRFDETS